MEITILMAKANWYYRNINKSNNIITTSKAIRKDEFTLVDSIDLYGNKIKIFTVK